MKVNELRIGNLLQDREGRLCIVESLEKEISNCRILAVGSAITSMPASGIPLTNDWLLRLGFRIPAETLDNPKKFNVTVIPQGDHNFVWLHTGRFGGDLIEIDVKYVHQLQNLYFALTGNELETKTPSEKGAENRDFL